METVFKYVPVFHLFEDVKAFSNMSHLAREETRINEFVLSWGALERPFHKSVFRFRRGQGATKMFVESKSEWGAIKQLLKMNRANA